VNAVLVTIAIVGLISYYAYICYHMYD